MVFISTLSSYPSFPDSLSYVIFLCITFKIWTWSLEESGVWTCVALCMFSHMQHLSSCQSWCVWSRNNDLCHYCVDLTPCVTYTESEQWESASGELNCNWNTFYSSVRLFPFLFVFLKKHSGSLQTNTTIPACCHKVYTVQGDVEVLTAMSAQDAWRIGKRKKTEQGS